MGAMLAILGVISAICGLAGLIGFGVWLWRRSRREPILLIEPFDTGRVLSRAFLVFRADYWPLFVLAALLVALPRLLVGLLFAPVQPISLNGYGVFLINTYGRAGVLSLIALGFHIPAMTLLIDRLRGGDMRLAAAAARLPGQFFNVIGLWIVMFVGFVIGMLFFVWPGVLLILTWSAAVPALLAEDIGILESLGRSRALTTGSRGNILLLYVLLYIGIAVVFGGGAFAIDLTGGAIFGIAAKATILAIATSIGAGIGAVLAVGLFASLYVELLHIHGGAAEEGGLAEIFA